MADIGLEMVCKFLLDEAGDSQRFAHDLGQMLRTAFDEVIDGPKTGRWRLDQLEKTEKTYIGTKVENAFRWHFGLQRGDLDIQVNNEEVDIKFTVGNSWMIPKEAMGHLCVLIYGDDVHSLFGLGLIRISDDVLTKSGNRDGKRQISSDGKQKIKWLVQHGTLPENLLAKLPDDIASKIMSAGSGNAGLMELFKAVQGRLIPRTTILSVAQQLDALKRLRRNGGVKDKLWEQGIAILGAKDKELARVASCPVIPKDYWIAVRIEDVLPGLREEFAELYTANAPASEEESE